MARVDPTTGIWRVTRVGDVVTQKFKTATRAMVIAIVLCVAAMLGACSDSSLVTSDEVDERLNEHDRAGGASPFESYREQLDPLAVTNAAVVTCMSEAGFENMPPIEVEQSFSMSDSEFAKSWGYGLATVFDDDGTRKPNAPNVFLAEDSAFDVYRSAFSNDERVVFDTALYGDDSGDDAGCLTRSDDFRPGDPADWYEYNELIASLDDDISQDEQLQGVGQRYGECMADNDHPEFSQPSEPIAEVGSRLQGVLGIDLGDPGAVVDGPTEEAIEGIDVAGIEPLDIDPERLHDVQKYELEVAQADIRCRVTLELEREHVALSYETQFVEDNRELLDRLVAEF